MRYRMFSFIVERLILTNYRFRKMKLMIAYIGTGAVVLGDVNWLAALSAGGMGFVIAILLALAGLPEVEAKTRFFCPATSLQFVR